MSKRAGCLIALVMLVTFAVLFWRPVSDFIAEDACLDFGGAVGPNHTCIH